MAAVPRGQLSSAEACGGAGGGPADPLDLSGPPQPLEDHLHGQAGRSVRHRSSQIRFPPSM